MNENKESATYAAAARWLENEMDYLSYDSSSEPTQGEKAKILSGITCAIAYLRMKEAEADLREEANG